MSRLHAVAFFVLLAGCPNTPERTEDLLEEREVDAREVDAREVATEPTAAPDSEVFTSEEVEGPDDGDGNDGDDREVADDEVDDEADGETAGPDTDVAASCAADGDPACEDDNPCTADTCRADGTCAHVPNVALCDDGNPCTSFDRCTGGACVGIGLDCDDRNPCTVDACADDVCSHTPTAGRCDDGDACTDDDRCDEGACVGRAVVCAGGGPCGDASCEPRVGCVLTPRDEGAACDDGNACTSETTCRDGQCRGTLARCDDGDPCTDDYCDVVAGCGHRDNVAPCDDGDPCTLGDRCAAGACGGQPSAACCERDADCDDGVACTIDRCEGGCHHDAWVALPPEGQVVADFEGALDGWTFASDNDLVGWRASDAWAASGTASLYCGDDAGVGYDHGATRASAAIPIIVPPVAPVLHVVTRRDVSEAGSCVYDALAVLIDGRVVAVVCGSGEGEEAIDLAGLEGRQAELAFVFDTIDGRDNAGAGVWIDRVRLTGGACEAVGEDP